jgi:hypothetical protein
MKLDAVLKSGARIIFPGGALKWVMATPLAGPRIGLNMNGGKFFNTTCGMKKK